MDANTIKKLTKLETKSSTPVYNGWLSCSNWKILADWYKMMHLLVEISGYTYKITIFARFPEDNHFMPDSHEIANFVCQIFFTIYIFFQVFPMAQKHTKRREVLRSSEKIKK